MQRLRRTADVAEDLLLVYYAGHGLRHERRDDLYLTVRQTDPEGLDGTAVQYDWVRDVVADCPARTRLLILDCCYSGLALGRMSDAGVDAHELEVTGTAVLASSPRNTRSHSPAGERYTAFTGELISLLKNGPSLPDSDLTVQRTFQLIKARLLTRSFPKPVLRLGDSSGQLVLRRNPPAHELPPSPARPETPTSVVVPVAPPRPQPVVSPSPVRLTSAITASEAIHPRTSSPSVSAAPPVRPPAPADSPTVVAPRQNPPHTPVLVRATTKLVVRGGRKTLFWVLFVLSNSALFGGLIGVLFGPAASKSADAAVGITGFAVTAGLVLALLSWTRRRAPDATVRTEVLRILPRFLAVPALVPIGLAVMCVSVAMVGLFGAAGQSSRSSGSYSELSSTTATAVLFLETGALFAQAPVWRRRSAKQASADRPDK